MRPAFWSSIVCLAVAVVPPSPAAEGPTAPVTAPDADAAYTRALGKRADAVLDALTLQDPAKAARVRGAVIGQYRDLRRLHDARDANIKSLRDGPHVAQAELDRQIEDERGRTDAEAAALHGRFLARLSADLTPEQVDRVKDVMTYHKLRVTYGGYLEMLPELTPEQKRTVFDLLKEAREEATYAGSAEEKSGVFERYKGRINNYLAAQGYDLKLASKRWAERRGRAK